MTTYTDISLEAVEALAKEASTILVDVREPWEFEEFNIGGVNIPLAEIRNHHAELLPFDTIVVVCTNGCLLYTSLFHMGHWLFHGLQFGCFRMKAGQWEGFTDGRD